jgi:hypothetical protein
MKTKLLYILAVLALTFVSADATTQHKATIRTELMEDSNGDYVLSIYGTDHILVCEEKPITIEAQGDAMHPIVLQCKH